MCGIAGIVDLKGNRVSSERIEHMNRILYHRGPDRQDVWLNGPIGLGHTRLAIIDLTPAGAQPMLSHSGRYVITFNGEIYNFLDLRQELERLGIHFRGASDTEVLLEAYAQWGPRLLERLEGMFAFAIWDSLTQELFLARDRFGKKPLHYVHQANQFLFASEIKALLAIGGFDLEWDAYALSDYLSLGYILTPRTLYQQIRRLPAGSYALLKEGNLSIHSYWDLHSAFEVKVELSEDERIEQLRAHLDQAVACRCLADVPLGAFLSGGLDSSSVVASMARSQPDPPHTFSMAFELRAYDESGWANQVSQHLGTHHFSEIVAIDEHQIFKTLIDVFDEPFADTSAIPMWYLSRLTRRHVTVALSGDGADEILAGYPTYQANHYFSMYRLLPEWTRQLLGQAACALPHLSHRKVGPDYKLRQFLIGGAQTTAWLAHVRWRELFSPEAKTRIMLPDLARQTRDYDPYEIFRQYFVEAADLEFLDACLYVDIKTWLQDDILVKVDRTTMAHSLEARAPFLDSRLVAWCASLPVTDKLVPGEGKTILKKAMAQRLPKTIIYRAKSGFNAPTQAAPLDIPVNNEMISSLATQECRTEFQRYCLAVLGAHLARRKSVQYVENFGQ